MNEGIINEINHLEDEEKMIYSERILYIINMAKDQG